MTGEGALAIELHSVEVRYGDAVAVREVSLEVPAGELHVLLGESGSGKTTLLRAIAGFEPAAAGRISLFERFVDDAADRRRWVPPEGRQVGVVFQDYALFPHLDVAGNVAFALGRPAAPVVESLLEQVGLAGYGRRAVAELSGGEQQRVALARTLAQRPRIVLLDEPFSNLNPDLREQLRDAAVRLLRDEGITAVLVTHDRREAFSVADRISVIREGRLLQTGTARQLYETPRCVDAARSVGEVNVVPATVGAGGTEAECVLGRVALREPARGDQLVVRPEQLRVHAVGETGCAGRVVRAIYHGAVEEALVSIEGGIVLRAAAPPGTLAPGDAVRVEVIGPAVCVL